MTEGKVLEIGYKKYTNPAPEPLTVHPYAVKENAKRWYLIAYCVERDSIRVYGLDRVTSLKITDKGFTMPAGFNIDELFATSFGIYLPEGKGQRILFRTNQQEARYIRDLPLHSTQWEESSNGDEVTFGIFVCAKDRSGKIHSDLIMEFCRWGDRIEVLSPQDIRQAVAEELSKAANIYSIK